MHKYESHLFGRVPLEYQHNEIRWIAIVTKGYGEPGVGIELFEDLSEGHIYDNWRENLDLALKYIEEVYGIKESDLIPTDEIRALGFKLFGD